MEFPFRTSTPSQSEIFSLKSVIVACSYRISFQDQYTLPKWNILLQSCYNGLLYVFAFQDQHTLPKWNILSKLLLWLALSARIRWAFRTSTLSQREIFFLKAFIVACSPCSYTLASQDQQTLPKWNILSQLLVCLALSVRMYVLAFQDQHTLPK